MVTSAVSADLKQVPMLIGGKPRSSTGKTAVQTNPATGEPTALIPTARRKKFRRRWRRRRRRFPAWSQTPVLSSGRA